MNEGRAHARHTKDYACAEEWWIPTMYLGTYSGCDGIDRGSGACRREWLMGVVAEEACWRACQGVSVRTSGQGRRSRGHHVRAAG
jgi:hypothetical protein